MVNIIYVREAIRSFLNEDLGVFGDLSSLALKGEHVKGYLEARENLVLCGSPFFEEVFRILDGEASFSWRFSEGEEVREGEKVCTFRMRAGALLSGERTALNIIQKLSGISTLTRRYVNLLRGTKIKLLDTRKTTPGLRYFEKYATRVGGAFNHRLGLYDAVMVKDNHIKVYGSIATAVKSIRGKVPVTSAVEVEVENWKQLEDVISVAADVDIVMFDNWKLGEIEKAVKYLREKCGKGIMIEVSGRVDEERVKLLRNMDIDFISTSRTITEARWVDIGVEVE